MKYLVSILLYFIVLLVHHEFGRGNEGVFLWLSWLVGYIKDLFDPKLWETIAKQWDK